MLRWIAISLVCALLFPAGYGQVEVGRRFDSIRPADSCYSKSSHSSSWEYFGTG